MSRTALLKTLMTRNNEMSEEKIAGVRIDFLETSRARNQNGI